MDISEIFSFDKNEVERYMMYELKLKDKFITSFNYLLKQLGTKPIPTNLSKLKWSEGKNYDWVALKEGNLFLLIRKYQSHFTIFFKNKNKISEYGKEYDDYYNTKYGCFTFSTDRDKLKNEKERDEYCDNNFKDLNKYIKNLITLMKDDKIHMLWNSISFKRAEHVEVKNVWNGDDSNISSIDLFIFACEELFQKYLEMFSENDMFEKIKTIKKNQMVGSYKVLEVHMKLKNEYYHSVGLTLQGTNGKDSERFNDVYSLTRWYYNEMFNVTVKS